jgi:hypothetical protein
VYFRTCDPVKAAAELVDWGSNGTTSGRRAL